MFSPKKIQTDGLTEGQKSRQMDKRADIWTKEQTDGQQKADRQIDGQADCREHLLQKDIFKFDMRQKMPL